jgi:molybdopterin-binding protein
MKLSIHDGLPGRVAILAKGAAAAYVEIEIVGGAAPAGMETTAGASTCPAIAERA